MNYSESSAVTRTASKANVQSRTTFMVQTALMVAITLVMGLTPLGTIRTPFLVASIVTVPIAISAIVVGWQCALICGAVFGCTSFFNAITGSSGMLSILFNVSPFGVFVTAVVARLLVGLCTGLIYKRLVRVKSLRGAACYITGLCAPLLNTLFFMSSLFLFFWGCDYVQGLNETFGTTNPFSLLIALVGIQGIIEAVCGCVLAGTVGVLLRRALRKSGM